MREDNFYRQLYTTVFPLVIQAFMLALVSATDAMMLGLVDQTSMSSVSLGGQVQFVLNLFVLGITGGLSILTAQYWGKGDHAVVERLIPRSLLYMLSFGGLFTLVAGLAPWGCHGHPDQRCRAHCLRKCVSESGLALLCIMCRFSGVSDGAKNNGTRRDGFSHQLFCRGL